MTISLSKGGSISLSKDTGLGKVTVGLGWDAAQPAKAGGLMGRMFGSAASAPASIDLDASVLVFDASGKLLDTVWFRQLKGMDGTIQHSGDNRTGEGDGDDETITIDLARISPAAASLVITVNSFTGQTFDKVDNAVCRLVDAKNNSEICRYELAQKGSHTGVIMAVLSRKNGPWSMQAIGETMQGRTVADMESAAKRFI